MNDPLDLVIKTLEAFGEKHLSLQVLDAFGKNVSNFKQCDMIARLFFELKKYDKSILFAEKALKYCNTEEEKYVTTKNLINACNKNNNPEKSLTHISKIKYKKPQDYELILEESFSYSALGKKEKSYEILLKLLDQDISSEVKEKAYHNVSGYYFSRDDLHLGLKHFLDGGEKQAYAKKNTLNCEKWDGTIVPGQTLLIDSQCGAGDEVMNVRFMRKVKELGMNPIWLTVRKDLQNIFNYNNFYTENLNNYDRSLGSKLKDYPKDSKWVYALSLPYYLNVSVKDLGRDPYLKPLPEKQKKYSYLKRNKKFKIGLFWDSGSGFEQAHFRNVDSEKLFNIFDNRDVSLYSLQLSDKQPPEKYKKIVKTFYDSDRNFEDTFSIIDNMDLIITSCTSVAHIAAAMGKEVCVILSIMEFYSWMGSTGKTWWYGDNVHLFRQKRPREWDEPLLELESFLDNIKI